MKLAALLPFLIATLFTFAQPLQVNFQIVPADNCLEIGSTTALPTGGTGTYTYLWSNGETTPSIVDLPYGIYKVTVSDGVETLVDSVFVTFWDGLLQLDSAKIYTGDYGYKIKSLDSRPDGGFLVSGMSGYVQPFPPYSGLWKETLVSVSPTGDIEWTYSMNSLYDWREPIAACGLDNGDAVQLVYVEPGADLIKHHGNNGVLKRVFYPNLDFSLADVIAMEGGYAVLANDGLDIHILCFTKNDSLLWSKSYGGSNNDWGYHLQKTTDGNIMVAGASKSSNGDVGENHGGFDAWFFKINNNGDLLWSKVFGGSLDDFNVNLANIGINDILATVSTSSNNGDFVSNYNQATQWFFKMDQQGDIIWTTADTSLFVAGSYYMPDGGILAYGNKYGTPGWYIFKLNTSGLLEWQYNNTSNYYPKGIGSLTDERFLVAQGASLEWYSGPVRPNLNMMSHSLNCHGDSLEIDITDPTCSSCTYFWSDGYTAPIRQVNLQTAPSYFVTITDDKGCMVSGGIELPQPMPFNAGILVSNSVAYRYDQVAWLEATPSGGVSPFHFNWSDGTEGKYLFNMLPGEYAVTIVDGNGCQASDSLTVTEGEIFDISLDILYPIMSENNGSINVITMGGTPPFTYEWNTNATVNPLTNLSSGNYWVQVFDALGCQAFESTTLESVSDVKKVAANFEIKILPNPTSGEFFVEMDLPEAMEVSVEAMDMLGRRVCIISKNALFQKGKQRVRVDARGWPSGMIFIKTTVNGQSFCKKLIHLS